LADGKEAQLDGGYYTVSNTTTETPSTGDADVAKTTPLTWDTSDLKPSESTEGEYTGSIKFKGNIAEGDQGTLDEISKKLGTEWTTWNNSLAVLPKYVEGEAAKMTLPSDLVDYVNAQLKGTPYYIETTEQAQLTAGDATVSGGSDNEGVANSGGTDPATGGALGGTDPVAGGTGTGTLGGSDPVAGGTGTGTLGGSDPVAGGTGTGTLGGSDPAAGGTGTGTLGGSDNIGSTGTGTLSGGSDSEGVGSLGDGSDAAGTGATANDTADTGNDTDKPSRPITPAAAL